MSDHPSERPALRLIPGGAEAAPDRRGEVPDALVERAVVAVVATSGGVPQRLLTPMVGAWLEVRRPGQAPPEAERILRALGMCILRREVDAQGGLLVPGPAIDRSAV